MNERRFANHFYQNTSVSVDEIEIKQVHFCMKGTSRITLKPYLSKKIFPFLLIL